MTSVVYMIFFSFDWSRTDHWPLVEFGYTHSGSGVLSTRLYTLHNFTHLSHQQTTTTNFWLLPVSVDLLLAQSHSVPSTPQSQSQLISVWSACIAWFKFNPLVGLESRYSKTEQLKYVQAPLLHCIDYVIDWGMIE